MKVNSDIPDLQECEIREEAERLHKILRHTKCGGLSYFTYEECLLMAPETLAINRLKKTLNATILAHTYVSPEIVYGVGDFRGDSYFLSLKAREAKANIIIFAGVVFMAETAKILSPHLDVRVPDRESGCSLADSITGEELRALKKRHPEAAVVCYVNSSTEVKAESDVCVTSSNVYEILRQLPHKKILFVPDRLMADNLRTDLQKRGIDKEIISSDGVCIVHEQFDAPFVRSLRRAHPDVHILAHPECPPDVVKNSDYVGSTTGMLDYVKNSSEKKFMVLSECGLVDRMETETEGKEFIGSCRLCPYMKKNDLQKIKRALVDPSPDQIISLDPAMMTAARRSLDRMFEMT